ncbi:MAG: alpha/beta fold hydrolase, partial [Parahaliea sp.]
MSNSSALLKLALALFVPLMSSATWAQGGGGADISHPGPRLVHIDYDKLYAMPAPPHYQPFDYYAAFLISAATQQTPMSMDFARPTPDGIEQTMDVVFKEVDGIKLALDIHQPRPDGSPNPLLVIIHGGYWKAGDKAQYRPYSLDFAAMGYTVATLNYRLSGQAPFPAAVEDIRDAIRYLIKHGDRLHIDPGSIILFGSSAGGHLAAFAGLAANTAGSSYMEGVDVTAIKAVISIYGIHDLSGPDQQHHAFTRQFMGADYEASPQSYREASTITHVDKNDTPVMLIHGTLDTSVPVCHSDKLSE